MKSLFERFDRVDTALNRWLVAHSITILRISLGMVFVVFGLLKFFPGLSPIEELVEATTSVLTFGLIPAGVGLVTVAVLEVAIGLSFITGRLLRVGVWLMGFQLLGAMSPLVLFPGQLFAEPAYAPTLAAQYIIKDVILIAAGMVVASTWTGGRVVAEPASMRSSLASGAPRVSKPSAAGMSSLGEGEAGGGGVVTSPEVSSHSSITDPTRAAGPARFKRGGG